MTIIEPPPMDTVEATLAIYNAVYLSGYNPRFLEIDQMVQAAVAVKFPALAGHDLIIVASQITNRVLDASIQVCDNTGLVFPTALEGLLPMLAFYDAPLGPLSIAVLAYLFSFAIDASALMVPR